MIFFLNESIVLNGVNKSVSRVVISRGIRDEFNYFTPRMLLPFDRWFWLLIKIASVHYRTANLTRDARTDSILDDLLRQHYLSFNPIKYSFPIINIAVLFLHKCILTTRIYLSISKFAEDILTGFFIKPLN